jgi:hypothetical protein
MTTFVQDHLLYLIIYPMQIVCSNTDIDLTNSSFCLFMTREPGITLCPISLDQYRASNNRFYPAAICARHILSLYEYQLINMLIFGGVKFLPCIIVFHFLRNDLEQEVT